MNRFSCSTVPSARRPCAVRTSRTPVAAAALRILRSYSFLKSRVIALARLRPLENERPLYLIRIPSSFRRVGVVPVAPGFAKLTVAVLDPKLGTLISRDSPSILDCFLLGIEGSGNSSVSFPAYRPPVAVRHNVLILRHFALSFLLRLWSMIAHLQSGGKLHMRRAIARVKS